MSILTPILFIGLFILLEGFFSGSETALISVNRLRLKALAQKRDKRSLLILKMLEEPDRFLGTTLVGTNITVICASIVFTVFLFKNFSVRNESIVTLLLAPLVLVFGEMIPKAVFRQKADKLVFNIAYPLRFFSIVLFPIVAIVTAISKLILRPGRKQKAETKASLFVTRDELRYLIKESEREGVIEPHERTIISYIFDFGAKRLGDVMVKFKDIKSLNIDMGLSELKGLAASSLFSRFPAYENKKDNFIGLVNILDILYEEEKAKDLRGFLRPVLFFKEGDLIDEVLFRLQSEKQHMAIVLDSNEKPVGLVTIKDLLDELAGETI